jgi:hypothetical protein
MKDEGDRDGDHGQRDEPKQIRPGVMNVTALNRSHEVAHSLAAVNDVTTAVVAKDFGSDAFEQSAINVSPCVCDVFFVSRRG